MYCGVPSVGRISMQGLQCGQGRYVELCSVSFVALALQLQVCSFRFVVQFRICGICRMCSVVLCCALGLLVCMSHVTHMIVGLYADMQVLQKQVCCKHLQQVCWKHVQSVCCRHVQQLCSKGLFETCRLAANACGRPLPFFLHNYYKVLLDALLLLYKFTCIRLLCPQGMCMRCSGEDHS